MRHSAAAAFTLAPESLAFPFHPMAIIGGVTGMRMSAWKTCLCDSAVNCDGVLSLCKNITGLTKELICRAIYSPEHSVCSHKPLTYVLP